jgi:hypothetical protein
MIKESFRNDKNFILAKIKSRGKDNFNEMNADEIDEIDFA